MRIQTPAALSQPEGRRAKRARRPKTHRKGPRRNPARRLGHPLLGRLSRGLFVPPPCALSSVSSGEAGRRVSRAASCCGKHRLLWKEDGSGRAMGTRLRATLLLLLLPALQNAAWAEPTSAPAQHRSKPFRCLGEGRCARGGEQLDCSGASLESSLCRPEGRGRGSASCGWRSGLRAGKLCGPEVIPFLGGAR